MIKDICHIKFNNLQLLSLYDNNIENIEELVGMHLPKLVTLRLGTAAPNWQIKTKYTV